MRKTKSYVIDLFNEGRYAYESYSQTQSADFWTSDTDAWLRFKIATQSVVISSAQINLYNKNDKSLVVEEDMTIVNNEAEFKMSEALIEHFGHWSVQVIFIINGKKHTSPTVEFRVLRELGADLPEKLGIISNWKDLDNELREFIAEVEKFTAEDFVELKMGEKLQNLEVDYATRLTTLTSQLAQKVTHAELDAQLATLLDGGPSIFMDTLALLQSTYPNGSAGIALVRETDPARIYVWDGSTWKDFGEYQGIELKEDSVTSPKLANEAVTPEKTTFFNTSKNLFRGEWINQKVMGTASSLFLSEEIDALANTTIVKIKPNETYTIRVHDSSQSNFFAVGTGGKIPVVSDYDSNGRFYLNRVVYVNGSSQGTPLNRSATFTNDSTDEYLFINATNNGKDVKLQVEIGSDSTEYEEPFKLEDKYYKSEKISPKDTTFLKLTDNLFTGTYDKFKMNTVSGRAFLESGDSGRTAIIAIEPDKSYTVQVMGVEESDIYVVGTHETRPSGFGDFDSTGRFYLNKYVGSASGGNYIRKSTFVNELDKYLFVHVSTSGKEPELLVTESDKSGVYTPGFYIPEKNIKKPKNNVYQELRGNIHQRNFRVDKSFIAEQAVITQGNVTLSNIQNATYNRHSSTALKMTVNSGSSSVVLDFPLAKPINLYDKEFALLFNLPTESTRTPRQSKFSTIAMYLETPSGWFTVWPTASPGGDRRYPGWNALVSNPSLGVIASGGSLLDLSSVSKIRVRVNVDPTIVEPYDIYLDSLISWDFVKQATVSLEFDDAIKSVYDNAFPAMTKRGMRGMTHVITKNIRTEDPVNYITNSQLIKMHDVGWDICSHTVNHVYLSEVPLEEAKTELRESQEDLKSIGIKRGWQYFVSPYGDNTLEVVEYARTLYDNYRMTGYRTGTSIFPVLPYAMETTNAGSRGLTSIKALIDNIAENGGHLPLMWHGEIGADWGGVRWETSEFEELLDYLIEKGVQVVTYSDIFA